MHTLIRIGKGERERGKGKAAHAYPCSKVAPRQTPDRLKDDTPNVSPHSSVQVARRARKVGIALRGERNGEVVEGNGITRVAKVELDIGESGDKEF